MKSASPQKKKAPPANGAAVRALIAAGLAIVAFLVYWPALSFDFVSFDDPAFVSENANVLRGLRGDGVVWAFRFDHGDYWHPLTWLSLMLDATLFGPGPRGFHFTNVLLHAVNAALVFVVLHRWTGAWWRSALVAALFALHPLRVESVAWITERKDVLSLFFALLAMWAYGSAKNQARTAGEDATPALIRTRGYWLALVFFICGLMTKAMVVTLPFVFLLLDFWPLRRVTAGGWRTMGKLIVEKLPFFLLTAASVVITWWGQNRLNEGGPAPEVSQWLRIQHVFATYGSYLFKTIWPVDLAFYYPHPRGWPWWEIAIAAVVLMGLCALAFLWSQRRPYFFTGWFWFFGTLVPILPLTRDWLEFSPDRFTYLPSIGLFIAAVWAVAEWIERQRLLRTAMAGAAGAVLVLLTLQTRSELGHWRNSEALYRRAIAVTKDNALAYYNLGNLFEKQEKPADALECFRAAIGIRPDYAEAHANLGSALLRHQQVSLGIEHYRKAIALNPKLMVARGNLGIALTSQGRIEEAIAEFNEALRVNPNSSKIHNDFGNTLFHAQRFDEAWKHYQESLRLDPANAEAMSNLGVLYALQGKTDDAIATFTRALALAPKNIGTLVNLGNALEEKGRFEEAEKYYREVITLTPGGAVPHFNLGRVLARLNRRAEAVAHLKLAVQIKPDYPEAKQLLGELGVDVETLGP